MRPHIFSEGDLVLVYDQDKDTLGAGKFEPLWYGPYIISIQSYNCPFWYSQVYRY